MNQIDLMVSLMRNDLQAEQVTKLKTVLESVLQERDPMPPIAEVLAHFERSKRIMGIKETTIKQYRREVLTLDKYSEKSFCNMSASDIKDYLARYREENHISAVTVQNKLCFLSSFFDYLQEEGYISKNPARGVGRILTEKRIKKAFSANDLNRIRAACITKRDIAIVEFLYSTGARVSECTALHARDVDLDAGEVLLFGKGHKERIAYINTPARQAIKAYMDERKAAACEPLFSAMNSTAPITNRAVELNLKKIGSRARVENVHPHRFRRTFATDLWKNGVPVETIKVLMGHSNIGTTLKYIDIDPCMAKEAHTQAMEKINKGFLLVS